MNVVVAAVGQRNLPRSEHDFVRKIGFYVARKGNTVISGGADGCDTLFLEGAIAAGGIGRIYLPWPGFGEGRHPAGAEIYATDFTPDVVDLAASNHPIWNSLSTGVRRLMCRNAQLAKLADQMIAYPRRGGDTPLGGTAHAMHCAETLGRRVYDLSDSVTYGRYVDLIAKREEEAKSTK
jgi:hypothetical protein